MIMADKLIELRKKNGWTQESLAARLGVSRQAISKWESAQSVPDLKNLEKMGQLFGVSTDFLIKDEMDMADFIAVEELKDNSGGTIRSVSLQEANDYLTYKYQAAPKIALGVALCILGFIPLVILAILSDIPQMRISEDQAMLIGISVLFVFLIPAVMIFIIYGLKGKRFAYLQEEQIETAYGVTGMVRDRKVKLESRLIASVTTGVALCMIALALMVVGGSLAEQWEEQWQTLIGLSLALIAFSVYLFVSIGIRWGALKVLLQEDDWSPTRRLVNRKMKPIASIYWLVITTIYLINSFATSNWGRTWIIWPVAGLVFAIIYIVIEVRLESKRNKHK